MPRRAAKWFIPIFLASGLAGNLFASRTTAIGLFARRFDSPLSKEIILRFPIFLSKAYTRSQKGKIMYPNEFSKLREQKQIPNRVKYTRSEYDQLKPVLADGNLITAEIYESQPPAKIPKKNKGGKAEKEESPQDEAPSSEEQNPDKTRVFIRLHHYDSVSNKMASFSIYARPENAVLEMVRQVMPIENDRYLARTIDPGSKIAVMAPLDTISLNEFYASLMQAKFDLRVLSGNEMASWHGSELVPLRNLVTTRVSYQNVIDQEALVAPPFSAAADNTADAEAFAHFSSLEQRKNTGFERELEKILKGIYGRTKADYLLVLNPDGKKSFARGFDLAQGGMIWYQDSFSPSSSATTDVLTAMVNEMQRPAVTLKEEQFEAIAQEKDRMSAQGASGGLASVAILDFYDRTGTPLYTWLSSSLSAAVDESMKKIFEYDRADEKKSTEAGDRYFKSPADITPAKLKDFQSATGADYLIFGFYSFNTKTNNIVIESKIYDLAKKSPIGGSTTESPVDVRLFNTVDEISQGIVQDIFAMTQGQNK